MRISGSPMAQGKGAVLIELSRLPVGQHDHYSCHVIGVLCTTIQLVDVKIEHPENPRVEAEEHYYNPDHENLYKLGFKPTYTLERELEMMLKDLEKYKDRISVKKSRIMPTIYWKK